MSYGQNQSRLNRAAGSDLSYKPLMTDEESHRTGSTSYGSTTDSDSSHDDYETPLPKMQMLVITIILLCEPLTSTILLPFIYNMVRFIKLLRNITILIYFLYIVKRLPFI